MTPMTLNLLTGICLLIAAFAVGMRQILLSPTSINFPCAPITVRAVMFILAAFYSGLGVRFLGQDHLAAWAGASAGAIAVLAGVLALYNVVLLWNVVASRLPAGIWRRLEAVQSRARRPLAHF